MPQILDTRWKIISISLIKKQQNSSVVPVKFEPFN